MNMMCDVLNWNEEQKERFLAEFDQHLHDITVPIEQESGANGE